MVPIEHQAEKALILISAPLISKHDQPILPVRKKKPGTGQKKTEINGFTLIELLIVITIISILFSLYTLTIRTGSKEDYIKVEARRLNQLIELALEEAILKNTEYGLQFNTGGYLFLHYNYEKNNWQPLESDRQLRERALPHDIEIELIIEERDDIVIEDDKPEPFSSEDKKYKPQVLLLSSEEITPEFSARFYIPNLEESYMVSGKIDGTHKVEKDEL